MNSTINLEAVKNFYQAVAELENSGTVAGGYANNLVESVLADLGIDYGDFIED